MKWLKLFENFNLDFKIKKEGNTYTTIAILPECNVGSNTVEYTKYPANYGIFFKVIWKKKFLMMYLGINHLFT
jgi:hypothetical protein